MTRKGSVTKTTSHPTSRVLLEEHSDMPVEPPVGEHNDGMTGLHTQQFVRTVKIQRESVSQKPCRAAVRETLPYSAQKGGRSNPAPPYVRGLFDDLVCLMKLRLGDSLSHCHEVPSLTFDIGSKLSVGILHIIKTFAQSLADGHLGALTRHESLQISEASQIRETGRCGSPLRRSFRPRGQSREPTLHLHVVRSPAGTQPRTAFDRTG